MKWSGSWVVFSVLLSYVFLIGCSGSHDPVTSGLDGVAGGDSSAGMGQVVQDRSASGNRVVWGLWRISISADRETVDVVPDRAGVAHFNVVRLLVVPDELGSVYVTGYFNDTADFDPNGGDEHPSNGCEDAFLCKFDTSGNFEWARTWGGPMWERGCGVAPDSFGNVYVVGYYWGNIPVDFNPSGGDPHLSNGFADAFLSRFDTLGNFVWARTWGGLQSDYAYAVALDGGGNLYITGRFRENVDFAPTDPPCIGYPDERVSNGIFDAYLAKYLPNGCW